MMTLFTSCTEEEINNFNSLNVLDEPKVSAEMAQRLAAGEHFATYEHIGLRIFHWNGGKSEYIELDENDFLPYYPHRNKIIINGNELYVSQGIYSGSLLLIERGSI
ncbi:MAG: hypothetical protein NC221_07600 [Duncaniella sp.]|nr:hypothetical protein [Muribaculum sp.]MCM1255967.1 hypothetical protein [Duncaniella sp.]